MKAIQIDKYAKNINAVLRDISVPKTDPRIFPQENAQEALQLVAHGHTDGKVMMRL